MGDRLARGLVALGAVLLTVHLGQHVVEGIPSPEWFFGLGVVGAVGLWATVALWPRGPEAAKTLVLAVLGLGLVWGGLAEHAADAAEEGLTATHFTGIAAGAVGAALLVLAPLRARIRPCGAGRSGPSAGRCPRRRS